MEDFSLIAEHSVKKKDIKNFTLYKILFPIILVLGSAFLCASLMTILWIELAILISIPVFIVLLVLGTSYLRTIEFDYRITNGELFFAEIYDKRRRVEKACLIISKLEEIAPYKDKYKESANRKEYDNVYDFSSSIDSPDVYYAVNRDEENGSLDIYFFEPSQKMIKLLRHYNRRTVVL